MKDAACLPEPWRCCATTRAAGRGLIPSTTPRVSGFLPPDALLVCGLGCQQAAREQLGVHGQDRPSRKAPNAFPPSDACLYHPGVPIFHDALKVRGAAAVGWDRVPGGDIHPDRLILSRCPGLVLLQEAHDGLLRVPLHSGERLTKAAGTPCSSCPPRHEVSEQPGEVGRLFAVPLLPGWGGTELRPSRHGPRWGCTRESLWTRPLRCCRVGARPCRTQSHRVTGAHRGWSSLQVRKGKAGIGLVSAAQGCTKGFHSKEKPPEPLQEESSDKAKAKPVAEFIIQGPKSAEMMQRERPR